MEPLTMVGSPAVNATGASFSKDKIPRRILLVSFTFYIGGTGNRQPYLKVTLPGGHIYYVAAAIMSGIGTITNVTFGQFSAALAYTLTNGLRISREPLPVGGLPVPANAQLEIIVDGAVSADAISNIAAFYDDGGMNDKR